MTEARIPLRTRSWPRSWGGGALSSEEIEAKCGISLSGPGIAGWCGEPWNWQPPQTGIYEASEDQYPKGSGERGGHQMPFLLISGKGKYRVRPLKYFAFLSNRLGTSLSKYSPGPLKFLQSPAPMQPQSSSLGFFA